MNILVTGGSGFVGSHLVEELSKDKNNQIIVIDNYSTGKYEFEIIKSNVDYYNGDLFTEKSGLDELMKKYKFDIVYHMAANADLKSNVKNPTKCLKQNTIVTSNVLESMRKYGCKKIAFASSSAIYGDQIKFPTKEDVKIPMQTSMYGASKLACEGLLEAYSEAYDFQVFIFRFVSLMGERYTHGCVYDFIKRLKTDKNVLLIYGNGQQKKSFIYVKDCVNGMILATKLCKDKINIFNIGNDDKINVFNIACLVSNSMKTNPYFHYTGGERGWIGDAPTIFLDNSKLKKLGWKPKLSSRQCITRTANWLLKNPWVFKE